MIQTLFLKDSFLFISIDGKEYEVSNPETVFYRLYTMPSLKSRKLAYTVLDGTEWPGGVELIDFCSDHSCNDGKCENGCISLTKLARLLPKEKKIYNPALSGYKPESDYKQFESPTPLHDIKVAMGVESSEPQEEQNTVEGWISLELQTPKPMQWVLVWIEERKMSFMACRRAYPDEQSYSMWDSPFDEVAIYNGEIYYWKPMPNFTLTRLTP